ncbi:MAG: right-handed parallel beta-helix repeat-containing protein, partial [Verrucomicrobiota bacterium]
NLVFVDYSFNNAQTWLPITLIPVPISDRRVTWLSDLPQYPVSPQGRWRIRLQSDPTCSDTNDRPFRVNGPITFYVNDGSTANDCFTTAVGSDTNLGFFPNSPMRTLDALLRSNDVEGADIILVDHGDYRGDTNALFTTADSGTDGNPVFMRGCTNGNGTLSTMLNLNGGNITISNMIFDDQDVLIQGGGVTMEDVFFSNATLRIVGGNNAIRNSRFLNDNIDVQGSSVDLANLRIENASVIMLGSGITISNSVITGDGASPALVLDGGTGLRVINNTLVGRRTQFNQRSAASATLLNNIIIADGPNRFCMNPEPGTAIISDFNNLVARNGAWIGQVRGDRWEHLVYWQREASTADNLVDRNSISAEPLFVDEAGGNYRLQSTAGHWDNGVFVNDVNYSPSIDAGDNTGVFDFSKETPFNGNRINQGAYGNSAQASRSIVTPYLQANTANDGGSLRGTNVVLSWDYLNVFGETVRVNYSTNNGVTWMTIASGVNAEDGMITINTDLLPQSLTALWRVTLESNSAINDQIDTSIAVRNGPLNLYVNDGSNVGDMFTTALGNNANDGLAPGRPLASVQEVLRRYDLDGQDTVFVDTGVYSTSNRIDVNWSDGGYENNDNMVIEGVQDQTIFFAGGTGDPTNTGFVVHGDRMTLRNLTIREAAIGIIVDTNEFNVLEGLNLHSNATAARILCTSNTILRNSRIWNNTDGGVDLVELYRADVYNNTFYGNAPYSIHRIDDPAKVLLELGNIENNIFDHTTAGDTAIRGSIFELNAEYNVYNLPLPNSTYLVTSHPYIATLHRYIVYSQHTPPPNIITKVVSAGNLSSE